MFTNYFAALGEKCITELCYYLSHLLDGTQNVKPPACNCLQLRFSVRCELSNFFWKSLSFKIL